MSKPIEKRRESARKRTPLEKIVPRLGIAKAGLLAPGAIEDASRERLLEVARLLGLKGISRLRKKELADRLRETLAADSRARAETEQSEAEHRFAARKFAVAEGPFAEPRSSPPPEYIPWSYGQDRVRAMAVDPERLFVYWEVTDEAIAKARRELGPDRDRSWLSLRVYDTTGRLFDGTNAHSYFDHRVGREDRQWFVTVGKPGSEGFVEIGMKSREGYFVKIARSGRIVFPRLGPLQARAPEWLTVRAESGGLSAGEPGLVERWASRTGENPPSYRPVPSHAAPARDSAPTADTPGGWTATETAFASRAIEGEASAWEAPVVTGSWEAGPFAYSLEVPHAIEERYEGTVHTYVEGGRTRVVFGPWEVIIRSMNAYSFGAVVSRWELYRSRVTEGREVTSVLGTTDQPILGSAGLIAGASERRWRGASEHRLAGASELFFLGASERRLRGASERFYMGASGWSLGGASERRIQGASERRLGGASEKHVGASERPSRVESDPRYPRVESSRN